MSILKVLLEKEFKQILRDPFIPRLCVMMPLMVMLIMPLVTTMDVKHLNVAIVDRDNTTTSARIVNDLKASDYFIVNLVGQDYRQAFASLEKGDIDAIVELPEDLEKSAMTGKMKKIRIPANGVDAQKAGIGLQYLSGAIGASLSSRLQSRGISPQEEIISVTNHYNPTLEYRYYMIPSLMIMLIVMLCGFMPALNIVNEKERGTIEQINVSPVGRFTFTLGKLIPFWVIGLCALTIGILIAWLVYGLLPAGSLGAIYMASGLYILVMTGLGVVIANHSETLQQTMFVMFFFVMLFIMMSGLLTPIASMPQWARYISAALPPRYYVEIMRAVYLKGAGIADLFTNQYLPLVLFAVLFNLWAAISYRKRS